MVFMTKPILPAPASADAPISLARAAGARSEAQVVRDLLPFLKPFTGRITLALALVGRGKLANLVVPMLLKKLVDTRHAAGRGGDLHWCCPWRC